MAIYDLDTFSSRLNLQSNQSIAQVVRPVRTRLIKLQAASGFLLSPTFLRLN